MHDTYELHQCLEDVDGENEEAATVATKPQKNQKFSRITQLGHSRRTGERLEKFLKNPGYKNKLSHMGPEGKLFELCPKCGKRYIADMSKAGTRVKCRKLTCGHTFVLPVLPGHRTTGPGPRPRPKPKTSAHKTVLVCLISLLTIGSIVLGTVLLIKKNKTKPPIPTGPIAKPTVKPPVTTSEGQVDQKTLAQMVGMISGGGKVTISGKKYEFEDIWTKLTKSEYEALPGNERNAMAAKIETKSKSFMYLYHIWTGGTCFLISPDGYAITNQHVTENQHYAQNHPNVTNFLRSKWRAESIVPQLWAFFDGEAHEASIVFQSPKFDFSILKISGISGAPFFKLSGKRKPDDLVLKTKVVTLGFPGSSIGPRTATEEQLLKKPKAKIKDWFLESDLKMVLKEGVVAVVKDRFEKGIVIEHDATINGGNSGGPLVSSAGLDDPTQEAVVYGINTWGRDDKENVFLSIMMETARKDIEQYVPHAVWVDK